MKILDLPLKKEWYNMIERGEKREEYRAIKQFWISRLCFSAKTLECRCKSCEMCIKGFSPFWEFQIYPYTHVRFRYGYTKRTMLFKIDEITIGRGNLNWGAPTDKDVFIIKFHEYAVIPPCKTDKP